MRNLFVRKIAARLILLCCFLSLLPLHASAWGRTGHRIVARVAARHLTEKTRAAIAQLLMADKEDSGQCLALSTVEDQLACVSTWADEVKRSDKYKRTAPFHFVDIPINAPAKQRHYVEQRDCPQQGCIIKALADYRETLLNSKDDAERAVALKFIVHLIGDLHQPLHSAQDMDSDFNNAENKADGHGKLNGDGTSDLGGNTKLVTWFDVPSNQYGCWNLHAVWDDGILQHTGADDVAYTNALDKPFASKKKAKQISGIQKGTVIEWANESLALAITHAYALPKPVVTDKVCEVKKGDARECDMYDATTCKVAEVHYRYHLGDAYFKRNVPVVDSQLERGGLRLAKYLNSIFDPTGK